MLSISDIFNSYKSKGQYEQIEEFKKHKVARRVLFFPQCICDNKKPPVKFDRGFFVITDTLWKKQNPSCYFMFFEFLYLFILPF